MELKGTPLTSLHYETYLDSEISTIFADGKTQYGHVQCWSLSSLHDSPSAWYGSTLSSPSLLHVGKFWSPYKKVFLWSFILLHCTQQCKTRSSPVTGGVTVFELMEVGEPWQKCWFVIVSLSGQTFIQTSFSARRSCLYLSCRMIRIWLSVF